MHLALSLHGKKSHAEKVHGLFPRDLIAPPPLSHIVPLCGYSLEVQGIAWVMCFQKQGKILQAKPIANRRGGIEKFSWTILPVSAMQCDKNVIL